MIKDFLYRNKTNIITILFLVFIFMIVFIIGDYNHKKCIRNKGKAVTNSIGLFEKCIYE